MSASGRTNAGSESAQRLVVARRSFSGSVLRAAVQSKDLHLHFVLVSKSPGVLYDIASALPLAPAVTRSGASSSS